MYLSFFVLNDIVFLETMNLERVHIMNSRLILLNISLRSLCGLVLQSDA